MSVNYNPNNNDHLLLLQDYIPAVANWFKLGPYICTLCTTSALTEGMNH